MPCHPMCPNAPDPIGVVECSVCGRDIFAGDDYYDINDTIWCEHCIEDARKIAED